MTNRRVLDAFAGTGAVGLEALSRGASHAVFIEDDGFALAALEENVARCHRESQATVLRQDALNPPQATAPCNLVFLDPPYGRAGRPALAALDKAGYRGGRRDRGAMPPQGSVRPAARLCAGRYADGRRRAVRNPPDRSPGAGTSG